MKKLYLLILILVFVGGFIMGRKQGLESAQHAIEAALKTANDIADARSRGVQKAQFDRGYWMGASDQAQCKELHIQDSCARVNGTADRGFDQK
jgi:hypothetical protein